MRRAIRKHIASVCISGALLFLSGCAGTSVGNHSQQPPPISVTFSPAPPTSLQTKATQSLTAVVSNDPSNNPQVSWTVSCGSSGACGSFNPTTTTSGNATTYTAPAAVPSGNTVNVTATSLTDGTKFVTATITITAPTSISVSFNPAPPTALQTNAIQPLTAVVSNDTSNNPQVSWTVSCGSSGACGSFNPTTTSSGSATNYSAPGAVPAGNTVSITAKSVTDPSKFATAVITITAPSTGTLSGVAPLSACPSNVGFAGGMSCYSANIDCPNTDTIPLTFGYNTPAGLSKGLIVLFGGTSGMNNGPDGTLVLNYLNNGYTVVQIIWGYAWEETNSSSSGTRPWNIQTAACRPATFLNWAFTNRQAPVLYPASNPTAGMCAEGFSAGSAAVAYSLSWYDADKYLDKVELLAGPVLSDIGHGCEVPNAPPVTMCGGSPAPAYCQGWPAGGVSGGLSYINGTENFLQAWTGDASCNNSSGTTTTQASFNAWEAESILFGANGATPNLKYPNTSVAAWLCSSSISLMNESGPQGWVYYEQVGNSGTPPLSFLVNSVASCNGPEGITTGTTAIISGGAYGGLDPTTAITEDMSEATSKSGACTKSPGH